MELKRKLAMVAATVAVALGAGHVMQNGLNVKQGRVASADVAAPAALEKPKSITPLAAGLGTSTAPVTSALLATNEPAAPILPDVAFAPTPLEQPMEQTNAPVVLPDTLALPETSALPDTTAQTAEAACPATLDVIASDRATLDLTLIAPCRASERVVLRHAGLAVTGMTSASGMLFLSLPGLEASGEVSALFADGVELNAAEAMADMPMYRRFAVQWMADDAFQINAFEDGAAYGDEGHVYAANPQRRLPNIPTKGGYMTLLGDRTAPLPMLAEVYTFPMEQTAKVDLTIEASVTDATCDRELLGEVLLSEGGTVVKTDLTMATPTCDAIGDVLVLNNPLPDMKLAAAN
ncbi:hypothetical protein [Pseudorhodobacter ferrugineus]|uniref:hypothetical protein n=1 Tax=Pseudorhodobacter ferrugineus TaxID=77008 RepID=UPI0003B6EBB1|nr:hypothetical protein [Pseudorhodobacter ferrugineus]